MDINIGIFLLAVFLLLLLLTVIILIALRRTISKLEEDLNYIRHTFVIWFITPLIRLYFWLLERFGKLRININGHIPWEGGKLVFVFNHPFAKLQDTFLLPIIIFYLKFNHYSNPIQYFPVLVADQSFGNSPLFEIIGKTFFVTVDRSMLKKTSRRSLTLEELKRRFQECRSIYAVFFPEGGRTLSAERHRKILRVSQEGSKLATPLEKGAAKLALDIDAPIIVGWSSGEISKRLFRARPTVIILGLLELLFDPRLRLKIDIGHPSGPLRPAPGESTFDLTQRIENKLLELGDYQSKRSNRGGK